MNTNAEQKNHKPKLLFLAGSSRKESFNKKLAKNACEIAENLGADATFIDLKDFDMPIYNGDLEAESGLPENALKLKELFIENDGFFIASPEYNSSITPLLKNALDWISRPDPKNKETLVAYKGKVAAISSTSPGGLGGLRALVPLRMMLGNIQVHLVPQQAAIGNAGDVFDEDGKLTDEKSHEMLKGVVSALVETTLKIKVQSVKVA